jgi:hypothetical protein
LKQGDTIKEDLNVATLSDLSLTGDFLALVEGTTRIEPKRSTSDESTSLTFCPSVVALLQSSPCKVVTNLKVDNKIVTVAENVNCSTTQNSVGLDATSGCIPDFNSKIQCIGTGCGNGKIIASSETNNVQEFSKEWLCKYFDRPEATVPLSMMNEFESCLMDKKNNKSSDMETETSNVEDDMCKYLVRKASNGTLHPSLSMQLNACTNTNPNLASTPAYSTPQQIIYAPMTPASSSTNSSSNSIALPQGAPQTAATATVSTESASFLTPLEAAPLTAPSVSAIDNE